MIPAEVDYRRMNIPVIIPEALSVADLHCLSDALGTLATVASGLAAQPRHQNSVSGRFLNDMVEDYIDHMMDAALEELKRRTPADIDEAEKIAETLMHHGGDDYATAIAAAERVLKLRQERKEQLRTAA